MERNEPPFLSSRSTPLSPPFLPFHRISLSPSACPRLDRAVPLMDCPSPLSHPPRSTWNKLDGTIFEAGEHGRGFRERIQENRVPVRYRFARSINVYGNRQGWKRKSRRILRDSLSFERGLNNTSSKFSNKFYHGSFVSRDTIRYERLISEGLMEGYYGNGGLDMEFLGRYRNGSKSGPLWFSQWTGLSWYRVINIIIRRSLIAGIQRGSKLWMCNYAPTRKVKTKRSVDYLNHYCGSFL